MIQNKAKQFISFVVYIHNCSADITGIMEKLYREIQKDFEKYEVILVDDASSIDGSLKNWYRGGISQVTVVKLGVYHGLEIAMNAGMDLAVGDYVYEIDCMDSNFPISLIYKAYEKAMEGNDIVTVCPSHMKTSSKLFYYIFNKSSDSVYSIRTEAFRVVSRRAINRVYSVSESLPYRKAAYAESGLRQAEIIFDGKIKKGHTKNVNFAIDSMILYTNTGFKISVIITVSMLLLALLELAYTIIIFCTGHPIEGWTTTMLVLTIGLVGFFVLQAIIIKFLSLILDLTFKKSRYCVESVQKITNIRNEI